MLISASYKTDIPTFYGDWFINRLRAGYCKMVNPYNRQILTVSLLPEIVDGFVFWTKNVSPFMKHLPEVKDFGKPFVIQHTINGYPRALESSVVDAKLSIENAHRVNDIYGSKTFVWRYDTIIMSSLTTPTFHINNFGKLAESLKGATDEVVVSFTHLYRKTLKNMNISATENGFDWWDPDDAEKREIVRQLLPIAHNNGMKLTICSQKNYLVEGVEEARCVDAKRLQEIGGDFVSSILKGNRKECGCFHSRDIGEYDTCPHGCVYCYAVQNRELALNRYKKHNPESEFLFEPQVKEQDTPKNDTQLPLF